jgi:hypothetical protein
MMNMICNTCFGSAICYTGKFYFKVFFKLSFWIIWGELYENYHYRTDFSFELQIIKSFQKTFFLGPLSFELTRF